MYGLQVPSVLLLHLGAPYSSVSQSSSVKMMKKILAVRHVAKSKGRGQPGFVAQLDGSYRSLECPILELWGQRQEI